FTRDAASTFAASRSTLAASADRRHSNAPPASTWRESVEEASNEKRSLVPACAASNFAAVDSHNSFSEEAAPTVSVAGAGDRGPFSQAAARTTPARSATGRTSVRRIEAMGPPAGADATPRSRDADDDLGRFDDRRRRLADLAPEPLHRRRRDERDDPQLRRDLDHDARRDRPRIERDDLAAELVAGAELHVAHLGEVDVRPVQEPRDLRRPPARRAAARDLLERGEDRALVARRREDAALPLAHGHRVDAGHVGEMRLREPELRADRGEVHGRVSRSLARASAAGGPGRSATIARYPAQDPRPPRDRLERLAADGAELLHPPAAP